MYTEFTAGDHTYKLRLTTQGVVVLEKTLGYNPLQMFMGIDEDVLKAIASKTGGRFYRAENKAELEIALEDHDLLTGQISVIGLENYDIFDRFVEDGHTMWDIIPILIEAFQEAGFLPKEEVGDSKN